MEIERLANQNPWWDDSDAIRRDGKVGKVIETGERIQFGLGKESQVLIGPRQLGKTTALKYDIYKKIVKHGISPKSILYYSFDTSRRFEDILDVINTFIGDGAGKTFLYLDEVGFVEGWQRAVKSFLDSGKSSNSTLHVTGSSSINLRKELMPGRKIKFTEFSPLTFRKFLKSLGSDELKHALDGAKAKDMDSAAKASRSLLTYSREIEKWFAVYLSTGGFPDAIFDYLNRGKISDDIYDIHWNAFVSDISKSGKSVELATAVVYGLVESYASKVNLSSIARIQGIKTHVTVREYIETLEDLFMVQSVFPLSGKRYVFRKERKVYFNDPFMYNLMSKKTNIVDKNAESKIVEGVLYSHVSRFINAGKSLSEPKTAVGFLSGKQEVDFVIGDLGLESKWQNKVVASDFPNAGIKNKVLLSKKTFDYAEGNTVNILPLSLFLAAL